MLGKQSQISRLLELTRNQVSAEARAVTELIDWCRGTLAEAVESPRHHRVRADVLQVIRQLPFFRVDQLESLFTRVHDSLERRVALDHRVNALHVVKVKPHHVVEGIRRVRVQNKYVQVAGFFVNFLRYQLE